MRGKTISADEAIAIQEQSRGRMYGERRDYYRDTDERMRSDATFRAAVHMLMNAAREHGFTPGELRQIAFRAALELELRR